ncbi:sugar phosphate isomerase/epimerase [Pedobacter sp. UYP30]|uniref:sugar phosphate isomerase/epimerase family protein n=1 Tax=Pedobacter sp. UYP30 TaxID=1756400 RepID=UPI003390EEA5
MTSRRSFVKQASFIVGAAIIAPSLAFNKVNKKVGLQLYTLRDLLPKNPAEVIKQIAKAGYKEVETFGLNGGKFFGYAPKDFKKLLADNGLTAPSGHYGMEEFDKTGKTDNLKADMQAALAVGSDYFTIASASVGEGADGYKKLAENFTKVAEIAKGEGLKFAYHNHNSEFKAVGDTTGYQILLKESDKNLVNFEMDIYWVVRGGKDPITLIKENPGRFVMWHVKDMDKQHPEQNTEVGNGSIDFKSIFAEAKLSGMKHFFVEHENNYYPDPIASIKTSCDYIKKNLLS